LYGSGRNNKEGSVPIYFTRDPLDAPSYACTADPSGSHEVCESSPPGFASTLTLGFIATPLRG
jgi:hypothetical protein